MIKNDLLEEFNSKGAEEIFRGLYGEDGIEAARLRYSKLAGELSGENFPKKELSFASGKYRVFTAPGRTELAGNHTDHNRGKVLAASIQMDCAAIALERSDNIVYFRSTGFPDVKVKLTDSNGKPDLEPKPEEAGTTEAIVRGIAAGLTRGINGENRGCAVGGFTANAQSAVFPGSGLSSSAAVEVLICRVFDSLYCGGKRGSLEIAQIGQYAENAYFGKPCGLMDQAACSSGGAVAIDFADSAYPKVRQISFNPITAGYALCVVNTGGSHADLTPDYASIPAEMKAAAALFGKSVLRELDKEAILSRAAHIRQTLGDRALLRSLHFFEENRRVDVMTGYMREMENARTETEKKAIFCRFLELVNESGDSSWELLQNVYSSKNPASQGITTALALTRDFMRGAGVTGACRVHGGGFAGTIQAYLPVSIIEEYRACIETVFGAGSVTPLRIRTAGAVELSFA